MGRFCADRVAAYGELLSIELEQARIQVVREVIAQIQAECMEFEVGESLARKVYARASRANSS
ncbi:hypothetical protein PTKU64_92450 (plasmid) [Paraburkholderia terrae]|uniref:Uncharacterized protein n=1 Tax=Paraburkholderia terrae TaxID=311230 RepID=A0ABM7U339_9BURK|nr:hypothetical protein PTKU64_92450 [Paraburkholderia terrae]